MERDRLQCGEITGKSELRGADQHLDHALPGCNQGNAHYSSPKCHFTPTKLAYINKMITSSAAEVVVKPA